MSFANQTSYSSPSFACDNGSRCCEAPWWRYSFESGPSLSTMRRSSVLLADEHLPMLEAIRSLLAERFVVVVMVADARSMMETLEKLQPDLVVVDVSLPHIAGQNVIAELHDCHPRINVVALSAFSDRIVIDRTLASGAAAVVLKSSAIMDLGPALDAVECGRQFVSPGIRASSELFSVGESKQFIRLLDT